MTQNADEHVAGKQRHASPLVGFELAMLAERDHAREDDATGVRFFDGE
jgi:hypothetical protein